KAVIEAGAVGVIPDDVTGIVDAVGDGRAAAKRGSNGCGGVVERRVDAVAVEKAMSFRISGNKVIPDDFTGIVDAGGEGPTGCQRVVERRVDAAAVEKAVTSSAGDQIPSGVKSDDLAAIVDAVS